MNANESAPTKYHLSNLPPATTLENLVQILLMRWRIERDYQELKDEIGIDYFEGRSWRGFHHHAALCMAAYGFLAAERARLFPLMIPHLPSPKPATTFTHTARFPKNQAVIAAHQPPSAPSDVISSECS